MIKTIITYFKKNTDKIGHFVIGLLFTLIMYLFNIELIEIILISALICILKELYDLIFRKTGFDLLDIAFYLIGMFIIMLYKMIETY